MDRSTQQVGPDLFGDHAPARPEYHAATHAPADRMFSFPETIPGQLAMGLLETVETVDEASHGR
jgi:hypothetical protein